jgi:hypothetical protein
MLSHVIGSVILKTVTNSGPSIDDLELAVVMVPPTAINTATTVIITLSFFINGYI